MSGGSYVFAVVKTGGKQYRVEEGRTLTIDRIAGEPGDSVELGEILMIGEGSDVTVGVPTVAGARVIVGELPSAPAEQVRNQVDRLKQKAGSAAIVVGWEEDGKVQLIAAVTDDLVRTGEWKPA